MYFLFFILRGWRKRSAVQPQTIYSEFPKPLKKILAISGGMVVCMGILMSLYGACEMAFHTGLWSQVPVMWVKNIPYNFIMALPFQFLIAGPLARKLFRTLFPVGTVL